MESKCNDIKQILVDLSEVTEVLPELLCSSGIVWHSIVAQSFEQLTGCQMLLK